MKRYMVDNSSKTASMEDVMKDTLFSAPQVAPPMPRISYQPSQAFFQAFQSTQSPQNIQEDIALPNMMPSQPQAHTFSLKRAHIITYSILFFVPILGAILLRASTSYQAQHLFSPSVHASTKKSTQTSEEAMINPASAPNTTQNAAQTSSLKQEATAKLTSASAESSQDMDYELSLAEGFLKKAVTLSNQNGEQTIQDKNSIVQYLQQALEAANRAVAINQNDSRPFSTRGRVYQAIGTINPEMKPLALADFNKAKELGSSNPTASVTSENPVEHLPTKQATTTQGQQAMIAAPEEEKATTSTNTSSNLKKGTITFETTDQDVFVASTAVHENTQIALKPVNNPENATFFVKSKTSGKGFTITTTQQLNDPVDIAWTIVE